MAIGSNNITSNSSYEWTMTPLPSSDCIPWLVVLITECLTIVFLNIITIIVFVKQRQLQRRSTYLIIHLAVVDLLVGAVSGPLQIELRMGSFCDLWSYNRKTTWSFYVTIALMNLFSLTSLVNLIFISLERLHATFRPFRHRYIKKWVYGVIITVIWLMTTTRESIQIMSFETDIGPILYISFFVVLVFVICISYLLIVIKVRCSRYPHHHGIARRERKLIGTSLIVAFASLLLYLPVIIFIGIEVSYFQLILSLSNRSQFHIWMSIVTLHLANSIVNPTIYSLRMPEFRSGVSQIFRRHRDREKTVDLLLHNLRRA